MEDKKNNFQDALILIVITILIIGVLIFLDSKIEKEDSNIYRPIHDEGHLRWGDG